MTLTYAYTVEMETNDPDAEVYVKEAAHALIDAVEFGPHDDTTCKVRVVGARRLLMKHEDGQTWERDA